MIKIILLSPAIFLFGCVSIQENNGKLISEYVIYDKKDSINILSFPPFSVSAKSDTNECRNLFAKLNQLGTDSILVDEMPKVVKSVAPQYPIVARKDMVEGETCVRLWINVDGTVRKAKAVSTSDELFVNPSLIAAIDWKFTPALKDGREIEASIFMPFKFKLNKYK